MVGIHTSELFAIKRAVFLFPFGADSLGPVDALPFWLNKSVLIAGGGGLVGGALVRALSGRCARLQAWRREDGDLREPQAARAMLALGPFDVVFVLAATQGGLADHLARPLAYVRDNAAIALNCIGAAADAGIARLVFAASSALYPDDAEGPFSESQLAIGRIDSAHRPYASAKLLGVRLCEAAASELGLCYVPAILGNIYGPGGRFDPQRATFVHALIARALAARRAGEFLLDVWGSGRARRDVLHVEDAAAALMAIAQAGDPHPINVASGLNPSVADIAALIAGLAGLEGVRFDASKPEGALSRAMDISRLRALGFAPKVALEDGIARTFAYYAKTLA